MNQEELKAQAALRAVQYVREGMIVGLGTGSTAKLAIDLLARRIRSEGLNIIGIPTSEETAEQARSLGIPLSTPNDHLHIDLTFDGADEVVLANFNVTKGRGGALLREKIVAAATKMEIIMVDQTKVVTALGSKMPIPVEVIPFGWRITASVLEGMGVKPRLRPSIIPGETSPYLTDGGNYVLDCQFDPLKEAATIARMLKSLTGVVEHGIFVDLVHVVIVAGENGVEVFDHRQA